MFEIGQTIVGRVEIDPAEFRQKYRDPGMRSVRTAQLLLARRRLGQQIARDIAGRQPHRAGAGDEQMGEVLADAALLRQHLRQRRRHRGGRRIIGEFVADALVEVEQAAHQRTALHETDRGIGPQIGRHGDEGTVETEIRHLHQGLAGEIGQRIARPGPGIPEIGVGKFARAHLDLAGDLHREDSMRIAQTEKSGRIAVIIDPALIDLGRLRRDAQLGPQAGLVRRLARRQMRLMMGQQHRIAVAVGRDMLDAVHHLNARLRPGDIMARPSRHPRAGGDPGMSRVPRE